MNTLERATKQVLALVVSGILFAGCSTFEFNPGNSAYPPVAKDRNNGTPAHVPAHGYRHKHPTHDVNLMYDANLGVYSVVEHDEVYFHDGLYFHWSDETWYVSATLTNWRRANASVVPPGLKADKDKLARTTSTQ